MIAGLLLQLFAATADGQAYLPKPDAFLHNATKAAASALTYQALTWANLPETPKTLLSTAGVLVLSKALEVAKGHTLGPWDTLHDATWHVLGVQILHPKPGKLALTLSLSVALCHKSSPRWC